jgi:hypothetical protein
VPSPRQSFLLAVVAEFGRATAAAQRYEDLRYRSAWHGRIAPADIPRRIFEEFYSFGKAVESRRPGWRPSDSPAGQCSTAKALS